MSFAPFWRRLAALYVRRPWVPLLLGFALAAAGLVRAARLELKPQLYELLPSNKPSVVELHRVLERTKGLSNVFVVLEGADRTRLRPFGDALVARLRGVGPPWVGTVDSGVQEARAFLAPRAGLFSTKEKLEELRDELDRQRRQSFSELIGADLDEPTPPVTAKRLEEMLGTQAKQASRYPDGYFESEDGRTLVVVVKSAVVADDLERSREAVARVKAAVAEVHARPEHKDLRVSFAGDLVTGIAEYSAIRDDLVSVGALGVSLVLGIVLLFYLRLRALLLMGATIAVGMAFTFGLTELLVGRLNTATGFLFSIVAGNGINSGIIFQSRYLEERERGTSLAEALSDTLVATWRPTLMASLAAAAAYAALATTDFRGFQHFAFIGAAGMLLCWLATFFMLPPLVVASERLWPIDRGTRFGKLFAFLRKRSTRFDAPFTFVVPRLPRVIAVAGAVLGLAGAALTVRYFRGESLEHNLRRMENDRTFTGDIYRAGKIAADIVGANTEGGMLVLADRLDQVAPLQAALRAKRDAAPPDRKPFEEVHSLLDFVPPDQAEKLPVLLDVRTKVLRARELGAIADEEWTRIQPYLPPETLTPFGQNDLPEAIKQVFAEKDGTVGRVLFIEPTAGESDTNLHYLLRWASSFRETKLPTGEVIHGSGRAVIYADLLQSVLDNMPRALTLALLLTLATIWIAFRRVSDALPVVAALLLGLFWLGGALYYFDVKIHFVNFVALPITLGIGADYAVNIMSRFREAGGGPAGVRAALRGTSGAVILCSLTTTLGYLALLMSRNQAVRSLGLVAVLGEITCLLAAVLVLPAALLWANKGGRHPITVTSAIGNPSPRKSARVATTPEPEDRV